MMVATQHDLSVPRADRVGIDWQEVPCPLCGEERSETVAEAPDNDLAGRRLRFAVARCRHCGLWFTNPRPSPASMGQFYADDYKPHRVPTRRRVKALGGSWLSRVIGRPCRERHFIPKVGQNRLLDFGCGGGEFLLRMQDQGWQVTGLDSSTKVIRFLQREYGLNGIVGTMPHPQLAAGSFDVITMWASLEHVHQPLQVLRDAYRLLSPGGRLYVQVHNLDSWDRHLFGQNWFSLDLPRHLTHFTATTLRKALHCAGFRTRELRQISHPSATRKSLEIAIRARSARWNQRLLRLKPLRMLWAWTAFMAGGADHLFAFAERPG